MGWKVLKLNDCVCMVRDMLDDAQHEIMNKHEKRDDEQHESHVKWIIYNSLWINYAYFIMNNSLWIIMNKLLAYIYTVLVLLAKYMEFPPSITW